MDLKHGHSEKRIIVFGRVLQKMYVPVKDGINEEFRRRKIVELEALYNSLDILKVIIRGRLRWADHGWRSRNLTLRAMIEQNPVEKRPLGRPRMRWKDVIKKNVKQMGEVVSIGET